MSDAYDSYIRPFTVPNAGAAVNSNAYQLAGERVPYVPVSILTPSNLRGVASAKIQVSDDGVTYVDILPTDTIALTASRLVLIPNHLVQACLGRAFIRFVANTNPSADLTFSVGFAPETSVDGLSAQLTGLADAAVTDPAAASASQSALLRGLLTSRTARIRATLNSVSPGVLAAAGDYAALDVMNESASAGHAWILPSIARNAGEGGTIRTVVITASVAGAVPRLRMHLWSAVPTVLQNDNVAFLADLDDRATYQGYVDLPALQTSGSSEISWAVADQIAHKFQTLADANMYFVLQTLDPFTNEAASMTVDVAVYADRE